MVRGIKFFVFLVAISILFVLNTNTNATFTPTPSANFYPIFGNSSTYNFIDITASISANGHPGLVGKTLYVYPLICNGPSLYDFNDCELDPASGTTVYFADAYTYVPLTFYSTAMYYLGNNYIGCYVYDATTNNGDACGGYPHFDYKEINYTGSLLPVYRFWSEQKKHHFFTQSHSEKKSIESNYTDYVWKYEKPAFFAHRTEACSGSYVYRFWSDTQQGHFYTTSNSEKNYITTNYPSNVWRYEGTSYCVPTNATGSAQPVYRFWSDSQRGHFYTIDESERDHIIASYPSNVWRFEGIAFYAYR